MNVNSDKQTLILAGEALPQRAAAGDVVATRIRAAMELQRVTVLVVQEDYAAGPWPVPHLLLPPASAVDTPAEPARSLLPYLEPNRFISAGAAEYARTQNLSGRGTKSQLIDTYA